MAYVLQDDSLPHQVRVIFDSDKNVRVSCNCLADRSGAQRNQHGLHYEPMEGYPRGTEGVWRIYADPKNHNTAENPFRGDGLPANFAIRQARVRATT